MRFYQQKRKPSCCENWNTQHIELVDEQWEPMDITKNGKKGNWTKGKYNFDLLNSFKVSDFLLMCYDPNSPIYIKSFKSLW